MKSLFYLLVLLGLSLTSVRSAVDSCALTFTVSSGSMTFNDITSNNNAVYDCAGLSLVYVSQSGSFFGALSIVGTISRTVSTGTGPLNTLAAATLNVNLGFFNNGPLTSGFVPLTIGGLKSQPDWQYFQVNSGTLSSPDMSVQVAIRGTLVNNRQRSLQYGGGAGTGNIFDTSCALDYTFRYFNQFVFIKGGFLQWVLAPSCTASEIYPINNFNNSPFNSGPLDYALNFTPYLQRRTVRFNQLVITPQNFVGTIVGLQPTPPGTPANNFLKLRANIVDPNTGTNFFILTLWFQGTAAGTGYGAPVGTPAGDWQYFRMINGILNHYTDYSGYTAFNLDSNINPLFNTYPPNLLGPAFQIGTGANTLNGLYGGFFAGLYQFRFGMPYHSGNLTIFIDV